MRIGNIEVNSDLKTILDKFSLLKFINMHIQIYKQLMNENS